MVLDVTLVEGPRDGVDHHLVAVDTHLEDAVVGRQLAAEVTQEGAHLATGLSQDAAEVERGVEAQENPTATVFLVGQRTLCGHGVDGHMPAFVDGLIVRVRYRSGLPRKAVYL